MYNSKIRQMLPGAWLVHRRIYIKAEINSMCLTGPLNFYTFAAQENSC